MAASRNMVVETLRELCSALADDANIEQYTREVAQRLCRAMDVAAEPEAKAKACPSSPDGQHATTEIGGGPCMYCSGGR